MARTVKRVAAGDGNLIAQEEIDAGDPVVLDDPQNISEEITEAGTSEPAAAADPEPEQIQFLVPASPFGVLPPLPGYARRHIDCQLSGAQAETLGRLLCGLDHAGARLHSGRRVTTAADAVRWLLEWTAQNGREE